MRLAVAVAVAATCAVMAEHAAFAAESQVGPSEPLDFATGCRDDPDQVSVTAVFVGDVLMHDTLQIQAARHESAGGFATTWSRLGPVLALGDVTYANLEGPVAENLRCDGRLADEAPPVTYANSTCGPGNAGSVYTNFPLFNYPPSLAFELARAGVDVVSTANNHALDRYSLGADMTLDALDASGIAHSGTTRAEHRAPLHTVTTVPGADGELRLAWLACTFSTNGLPDPHDQVLRCYDSSGAPNSSMLRSVADLASRPDVDAVIVTPHWGIEYSLRPTDRQRDLARRLVGAGALAVIGAHPHVLQPMERVRADGREGLVAYSLGNFVADQPDTETRTGMALIVNLSGRDGDAWIDGVRYVPFYMAHNPPGTSYARALVPLEPRGALGTIAAGADAVVAGLLPQANRASVSEVLNAETGPCSSAAETADTRLPPSESEPPATVPSAERPLPSGLLDRQGPQPGRPARRTPHPAPPAPWERTRL